MFAQPTLNCQDCGDVVKALTDAEAQMVAANPHNYIVWCAPCRRAIQRELERNPFYGME